MEGFGFRVWVPFLLPEVKEKQMENTIKKNTDNEREATFAECLQVYLTDRLHGMNEWKRKWKLLCSWGLHEGWYRDPFLHCLLTTKKLIEILVAIIAIVKLGTGQE